MAQLDNVRLIDADLSALAQDFHNNEFVWDKLFPIVMSPKEAGKVPRFNKEHFRIHKTERALRGSSNRLNWEMADPVTITMGEQDIEYPVDLREVEESEMIDLRQRGQTVTSEAIHLKLEKYVADLVQNTSTFPSGSKVTLTGGDKWSETSTSHPLTDIDNGRDAISASIVKDPNVIIFGRDAWRAFKRHPEVLALINGASTPGAPAVLTPEIAAKLLEIDAVYVGNALYLDDAGVQRRVWGDNVILAYVPTTPAEQRSVYEPSFAYTIRKNGYPQIDTYGDNGGKIEVVRNTDLLAQAIVGVTAGYLINDVV